jgi:hypothetical protein
MPNSVIVGRLRAIEGDTIILGGHCRIHIPPTISVAEFPIGTSLTVVVHQESDEHLIAERIERSPAERFG